MFYLSGACGHKCRDTPDIIIADMISLMSGRKPRTLVSTPVFKAMDAGTHHARIHRTETGEAATHDAATHDAATNYAGTHDAGTHHPNTYPYIIPHHIIRATRIPHTPGTVSSTSSFSANAISTCPTANTETYPRQHTSSENSSNIPPATRAPSCRTIPSISSMASISS